VFSFNVVLNSQIAQGNHSGQSVLVLSDTPENATQDILTYYGTDLASVEGPTLNTETHVLQSGKKAATAPPPSAQGSSTPPPAQGTTKGAGA